MALTLHAAIDDQTNTLTVDGADAITGDFLTIDSEKMVVTSTGSGIAETTPFPFQTIGVRRGRLGTSRAAHSSGASVAQTNFGDTGGGGGGVTVTDGNISVPASTLQMPPGTVRDAGGGTAAVGLILAQQVGPVHIAWDDADITSDILVAALPAGSIVWDVAVIPTVDWDGGEGQTQIVAQVRLNSTPPGGGSSMFVCDLFNCQSVNNRVLVSAPKTVRLDAGTVNGAEPGLIIEGGSYDPGGLYVKVFTDGAGLTAGEADVYAVIAAAS